MVETTRKVYECRRCGRVVEELLSGDPSGQKLYCACHIHNNSLIIPQEGKGIREMETSEISTLKTREEALLEITTKRPPAPISTPFSGK